MKQKTEGQMLFEMMSKDSTEGGSDGSSSENENDFLNDDDQESDEDESMEQAEDSFEEGDSLPVTNDRERKRKKVTNNVIDEAPQKKKKLESNLYKQPTVEELNELRETQNLFHSNLFRLQIEEMLNEVKIKKKYGKLFENWFLTLKETIESIPESEELELADVDLNNELGVAIPMPAVFEKTFKGTFKFLKPSAVEPIGSYMYDTTVGPRITIDIMVEMPSKMFQKDDYQNYRYLRKKAIYLAYIASSIRLDIAERKMYGGNCLRSVLSLKPAGKLGKKVKIILHVAAQQDSFKLNRFLPEKNSVRPCWYFTNVKDTGDLPPTPHYNSVVLCDLLMKSTNLECVKLIKEYPNIRDGIILLKIWLMQRELNVGLDGFNGHMVTMFVLYLLSIKKLNTFMSSYQIVRNVWNHLVNVSWSETGITMSPDNLERVEEYKKYYECVFLDASGYHNLAAYLSKSTFSWIQREADICLKHLESAHADSFQSLFMRKVPFYRAFDNIICIKGGPQLLNIIKKNASRNEKLNYGPDRRSLLAKLLCETLAKGLSNRVERICIRPGGYYEWGCTTINKNRFNNIFVGLELNPEHCFSVVDKGPEANLPEANEFRSFWGKRSDLRRFQDGSIREAVVWSKGKSLADRRAICKIIVKFLLIDKLNFVPENFVYIGDQLEYPILLRKVRTTHLAYGTGEEASLKVLKAFESLEKELMGLTDLPLSIHGVQGSSPVFRYTDVFPPLATNIKPQKEVTEDTQNYLKLCDKISAVPKYVHVLEGSLQLSTSGKWPDELEAIRKTKAAFHIQIAECLRTQYSLRAQGNSSHIDVMKDGFVFRLRIAHQKEIGLMKQVIDEHDVVKYRDNEESIEMESKLFELPKLTGALHGLHTQQPSFGAACRITKRWLSAQLLDNFHIPEIVVELLVASMYLVPAPYKPPQMPQVAFLRLLDIFARGHWKTDPIIVNFNNEMTREEIIAVETLFGSSRSSLPPLFISTPYDQQKSLWTRKAPSHLILNRISALATVSLTIYEQQYLRKTLINIKPMFRPALSDYDCLIRLDPSMLPRRLQGIDIPSNEPLHEFHPYKHHSLQKIPVVDFDPVQSYLKDLRNGYDEIALFFHDTYGGMVIGVLLKPLALESKYFKVSDVNCRKHDGEGKLVLNVSTMIEDFYILGKGIVLSINVQSSKFSLNQ